MKPLAVTGLGRVAPEGGFAAPSTFEGWPRARVAEVRGFDPSPVLGDKGLRNLDRLTKLFLVASRHALESAGLRRDGAHVVYPGTRCGVVASTAYGSLESMTELHRVAVLESPRYLNPGRFPNTVINSALGYVSIWEDLRALNATVCNGNCGALDAILCADTFLGSDRADAIVVGGAEAMHEGLVLGLDRLEALANEGQLFAPGDAHSCGMRLGEGAVMVTLERTEAALRRGATVLGFIAGYGTAFEPPESDALVVTMARDAIERAIRSALSDAGRAPRDVTGVVRAASGLARYDAAESEALAHVFDRDVAARFPKAISGETFGAGGAFALADGLAWLAEGGAHACVLLVAVGFYGNASAVVLTRSPSGVS